MNSGMKIKKPQSYHAFDPESMRQRRGSWLVPTIQKLGTAMENPSENPFYEGYLTPLIHHGFPFILARKDVPKGLIAQSLRPRKTMMQRCGVVFSDLNATEMGNPDSEIPVRQENHPHETPVNWKSCSSIFCCFFGIMG